MPALYFLDTSALLPRLLKRAPGHAWVENLCASANQNTITLAEVTEAEIAASLNQLVRGGTLRKRTCENALALFWSQVDGGHYNIIPVVSPIVRRAADLCSVRALKGYDAIQLACALTARDIARLSDAARVARGEAALGDPIFLTEDKRLNEAALTEGFTVDSPLNHLSGN
jgi:predicted nucleic acid-binding protein